MKGFGLKPGFPAKGKIRTRKKDMKTKLQEATEILGVIMLKIGIIILAKC